MFDKQQVLLREGWDYDLATGKPVDMRKPEENCSTKI